MGTAWFVGFGNVGGIVATFSFRAKDAPFYTRGYAVVMGGLCLTALVTTAYAGAVRRYNWCLTKKVGIEEGGEESGKEDSQMGMSIQRPRRLIL